MARRIYDTEVVMKVQERKQEHLDAFVTEHVVFVITQIENANSTQPKSISSKADSQIDLSTVRFDISYLGCRWSGSKIIN